MTYQSPLFDHLDCHTSSRYVEDKNDDENIITEEMLDNLRAECEAYGEIAECKIVAGGHAIVIATKRLFVTRLHYRHIWTLLTVSKMFQYRTIWSLKR